MFYVYVYTYAVTYHLLYTICDILYTICYKGNIDIRYYIFMKNNIKYIKKYKQIILDRKYDIKHLTSST